MNRFFRYLIFSFLGVSIITILLLCYFFQKEEQHLPKLFLFKFGASIPYHHKTTLRGIYISNQDTIEHMYYAPIRAKARGGSNADFPKRNYAIELDQKRNFCGLPKEDDWILNASFREKSFLRHTLSFDLYHSFHPDRIAPKTSHLEVYRNFTYQGLYVAVERMDAKRLQLDKADTFVIAFKEPPIMLHPDTFLNSNPERANDIYHQIYPELEKRNLSSTMDSLRHFIHYSSNEKFNQLAPQYFDLDEVIDWHILLLLTHNNDGCIKGFVIYKKRKNAPFQFAIWDYDHTFGRDTDGERHYPGIIPWQINTLMKRLTENNTANYGTRLKSRYIDLKSKGIINAKNLQKIVDQKAQKIRQFAHKNELRWSVNHPVFYDSANFEDEIKLIKAWIPEQLDSVDQYLEKW